MPYIIVLITASSAEEADLIAHSLIDSRLAACVNIIPNIKSIYTWKGKKEVSEECMLLAKTRQANFIKLEKAVKGLHSYDTPEIIGLAIKDADRHYLEWIEDVTQAL
jgi:periplasmic divalent cation tolerance protein